MTDITNQMQQIIRDNLPEATANEMKAFIAQAEDWREQVDDAHAEILQLTKVVGDQTEQIRVLKNQAMDVDDLEKLREDLRARKTELDIRERDIKLELAELKLQAANERNDKIESLVGKVFGHPNVTVTNYKSHTKDTPLMSDPSMGSQYETGRTQERNDINETETTEHGKK